MCMQQPLYCFEEGSSCTSLICVCSLYFIVLQKVVVEQSPTCMQQQHCVVLQKVVVQQSPMCMQQPLYCIVERSSSTVPYVYVATTILYCRSKQLNSPLCVCSNHCIVLQKEVVVPPFYVYVATTILDCSIVYIPTICMQ